MTARLALALAIAIFATTAGAAGTSYSAAFRETRTLPEMQQPLVLHGEVTFIPGRRLEWTITRPYHYRLVISGGHIVEQLPDGSRHVGPIEKTPWASALFNLFSALFEGDTGALPRYFKVTHTDNGYVLVPRSEMLAHSVKRITVAGKPLPETVIIHAADGGSTRLDFHAYSPPPATAASAGGR